MPLAEALGKLREWAKGWICRSSATMPIGVARGPNLPSEKVRWT